MTVCDICGDPVKPRGSFIGIAEERATTKATVNEEYDAPKGDQS